MPPLRATVCAAILIAFTGLPGALAADPPKPKPSSDAVKQELTGVIESQLAAFRTNDYAKAFTHAAEGIKSMFDLKAFESMVRNGYPVIANSKSATFGVILDDGNQAVVNVTVKGADARGTTVNYQYLLIREKREWKINGVAEAKKAGDEV
jgi:hypothetical protein